MVRRGGVRFAKYGGVGVRFAIYPSECVQYMKTEFYDMQNMVGGGGQICKIWWVGG